ncbi:uncharacterized protein [Mytilus edulis]|uniref:uncharacterized protein n=1 Tax=Mytilus edulis TaxID=6550 RepID=UPI0039EED62F
MTSERKSLDGNVAIVTGASSGIGEAIGITLAKAGAKVALAARRVDKLEDVKRTIEEFGGVCIQVKTDVAVRSDVKELVRRTETELGPVDIMINNAGAWYYTLVKNLHEDKWDQMIDVNCKGLTNGVGAVIDQMVKRKSGHIVNISSDSGKRGFPGLAVYTGSKFFMEGFSQTLRQEVCKLGIRVTIVQPGSVNVPDMADKHIDPEVKIFEETESGKSLEPEDIANAVLYAVTQPDYVGVNEILVQPREMPF